MEQYLTPEALVALVDLRPPPKTVRLRARLDAGGTKGFWGCVASAPGRHAGLVVGLKGQHRAAQTRRTQKLPQPLACRASLQVDKSMSATAPVATARHRAWLRRLST